MKQTFPIYTLLLAIYPILDLYSLRPGGVPLLTIFRPLFLQTLVTSLVFLLLYFRQKDRLRAGFLAGIVMFYFSSTGYFYRSIPLPTYPPITHLLFVLLGVVILAILTHPDVWQKYLTPARLQPITGYLNLISIIVLVFPLYRIGNTLMAASDDTKIPWTQLIVQNHEIQTLKAEASPDVYYIILDGYGRQDALLDVFGYDNTQFIEDLERLGFYVAKNARSNYIRTVVSLASSLNFNFLNFAEEAAGTYSTNYLPLRDLIQDNQARMLLEQGGYRTVAISSDYAFTDWTGAKVYLSPFRRDLTEIERFFYGSSALGAFYDQEFPFTDSLRSIMPLPSYGTRRVKIRFAFDQLKEIPNLPGPKFVFVHIIAPHPPFVFDAQGNDINLQRPYNPSDAEGFTGNLAEYQSLYIQQLQFVNSQIIDSIRVILSTSSSPPIIIIQGDHGSGSLLKNSSIKESCMYERTSILNAYYMPQGKTDLLYPDITPVNSFRVVFNTYFETEYPLLADQTYFSPYVNPYDFVDITDQIETTCQTR